MFKEAALSNEYGTDGDYHTNSFSLLLRMEEIVSPFYFCLNGVQKRTEA
ncbi:hypothetical protein [Niallia sp. NCCP-28]|nr:hypothetical protein [Niallia sp. NCCP-28]